LVTQAVSLRRKLTVCVTNKPKFNQQLFWLSRTKSDRG
jgi:hypothetical protein